MSNFLHRLGPRVMALFDKSSWLLIVLGTAVLALVDWRTALTLAQWGAGALAIGGLTIVVSRITFPHLRLTELLDKAKSGDVPAAMVVAALLLYCAIVFVGIVLWAK